MAVISPVVDVLALSLVAYFVISSIADILRSRSAARKYPQCKPPSAVANKYPLGIDMVMKLINANRENMFPRFLQRLQEEHEWTYTYNTLGHNDIVTSEPANVQALLATQFKDFHIGYRRAIFGPLLGDGIFTSDGPAWEHSRAMMRPQFARSQVSDLEMVESHVQTLFHAVASKIDGKGELDLQPLFFNFTMDSATEFLFGESVHSQELGMDEQATGNVLKHGKGMHFAEAFNIAQVCLIDRFQLKEYCFLYNPARFRTAITICHNFVDKYVDLAIAKQKVPVKDREKSKKYVFMDAIAEVTQDRKALRDQLLNILLAGRDTTASTLAWTFWYLARNKRVWKRLREEVIKDFGAEATGARPTFEAMKQSKYLQWVLNEVLRLEPIVPWNARQAKVDTILPTGGGPDKKSPIYIKKGTTVEYVPFAMHRRKDLWGEDAEEFRPERWGEDSVKKGRGAESTWKYAPFNGGPRVCLGQQFALTEASYVVIRLVQHYADINVAAGEDARVDHDAPIYGLSLTLSVAGGCNLKMTPA